MYDEFDTELDYLDTEEEWLDEEEYAENLSEGDYTEDMFGEGEQEYTQDLFEAEYAPDVSEEIIQDPLLGPVISTEAQYGSQYEYEEDPLLGPMSRGELEQSEYEIFPPDERRPIYNTQRIPYKWICHLRLRFVRKGRNYFGTGTGTLIGNRWVLTAGHCLFHPKFGFVKGIRVTPAKNGPRRRDEPYGSRNMRRFNAHTRWVKNIDRRYDYGLITLSRSFPSSLGYWRRIVSIDDVRLLRYKYRIAGYPGDKCGRKPRRGSWPRSKPCPRKGIQGVTMWDTGWKRINKVGPRLLLYRHDTYGGMSGSPVWTLTKTRPRYPIVIGIHRCCAGARVPGFNNGVRITPDVINNIRKWIRTK